MGNIKIGLNLFSLTNDLLPVGQGSVAFFRSADRFETELFLWIGGGGKGRCPPKQPYKKVKNERKEV